MNQLFMRVIGSWEDLDRVSLATNGELLLAVRGGPGRIRTSVGVNRRVYSPFPLAARAPTQRRLRYRFGCRAPKTNPGLTGYEVADHSVYFISWVLLTSFLK